MYIFPLDYLFNWYSLVPMVFNICLGFINVCHLCVCGVWLWGSSLEGTFLFTNHSIEILQPLFGHRSCVNIQNWDDYDVWTCPHSLEPSNLRK